MGVKSDRNSGWETNENTKDTKKNLKAGWMEGEASGKGSLKRFRKIEQQAQGFNY